MYLMVYVDAIDITGDEDEITQVKALAFFGNFKPRTLVGSGTSYY